MICNHVFTRTIHAAISSYLPPFSSIQPLQKNKAQQEVAEIVGARG